MRCLSVIAGVVTLSLTQPTIAEIKWSELKGAKHFGQLTVQEQQKIGLIETDLKAEEIARKSIKVASDICVFTNNNITVEKV